MDMVRYRDIYIYKVIERKGQRRHEEKEWGKDQTLLAKREISALVYTDSNLTINILLY